MQDEMRLGSNHMRGALRATRESSAEGQGRRCLPRGGAASQWATGLDIARGSPETGGTFVKVAVDTDVTKFPVLETGFMIAGVVTSEGCIMVTASPPDFGVSEGGLFFLSQGR